MTRKELKEMTAAMKRVVAKMRKDPEFAKEILHSTGMYDKDGKLLPQFK